MLYPKEEISFKNIKKIISHQYKYIIDKDLKSYISLNPTNYQIN